MASVNITFIGHASFLFEADGEKIFFDPWLAPENPVAKMTLDDIKEATTVCVTHGHIDHLGQAIGIVKKTNACLICSPEVGMYCDLHGIPYDTEPTMYALNVGGSAKWGKATYTAVPAVHSTNIMGDEYRAKKTMMPDGQTMGFVITFDNGIVLYDSGDTGVTMDMQIIERLYKPELCIMPAGGQYNMGIREFALACEFLKPKVVIPCHYDTFPRQRQDIEKLKEAVAAASPGTQVVKMLPGETWTYER
ncbi:MAG: metal-dependent hydrolase [Abditibacteriales bacterium]|nr:metal-dependent hydrolase [Abditibacteriales bacterium]MDW8365786.1 metal-dependent hydrolase [Abditibacteriales bacterium]